MEQLHPQANLEAFFARLAAAPQRALLLDYDGALSPFRPDRQQAVPYPGVREALAAIRDAGRTRVAIISGPAPPTSGGARRASCWIFYTPGRVSTQHTLHLGACRRSTPFSARQGGFQL